MNRHQINTLLEGKLGSSIAELAPLGGGSISTAYKATLSAGMSVFVKISPQSGDMFVKEANGLRELQKTKAITVPNVLVANEQLLILEFLPVSSPSNRKNFFEDFGRQFASLHTHTSSTFGFYEDNYIGSTPQKNLPQSSSWKEFYFSARLLFQFHLAEQNGYAHSELTTLFKKLEQHIGDLIPDDKEPPALLHGDLWSGNYLCVENDTPAIIDPAVYYGHREADLAMTLLFGGFAEPFYSAYNEAYPLNKGWEKRMELYKLYHLLNHLNLFGEGYYSQVVETMKLLV